MRKIEVGLLALLIVCFACGGNPTTSPSPQATPPPVSAPTPAPSPSPAPTPSPSPAPVQPTFTVSGIVRDGAGESPLGNVTVGFGDVRFNDCSEKLPPTVTTVTDSNGRYSLDVPAASSIPSVLSFDRSGFAEVCGELSMKAIRRPLTINVIMPRAACASAGVGFATATYGTDYIDLTWPEVSGAHDYRLEVGDRNGLNESILGVASSPFATANALSLTTGGAAHYRWNTPNLAPSHYFIRISAKLDCGWGPILSQMDLTIR